MLRVNTVLSGNSQTHPGLLLHVLLISSGMVTHLSKVPVTLCMRRTPQARGAGVGDCWGTALMSSKLGVLYIYKVNWNDAAGSWRVCMDFV